MRCRASMTDAKPDAQACVICHGTQCARVLSCFPMMSVQANRAALISEKYM